MSFFSEPERTFHPFKYLPHDLQIKIIVAALPSAEEVHAYRSKLLRISRVYQTLGRRTIAELATVNPQFQERVEKLLFRELRVRPQDLDFFERTCATGPRAFKHIRVLQVDLNLLCLRSSKFPDFQSHQWERLADSDAYDWENEQPTSAQSEMAAYLLERFFNVLGGWDRSDREDSHLLTLQLKTYPLQNLCWDFSSIPSIPAIGKFIMSSGRWRMPLHPSTSLSLVKKMPRLVHTNINLLHGRYPVLVSNGDARDHASAEVQSQGSTTILQNLPAKLTRLGVHAVAGLHTITKNDPEACHATRSTSIPISIAECGSRMSMLTHLDISEVPNIRFFFHQLAKASILPGSSAPKLWPNLRFLKIWRCFLGNKLLPDTHDAALEQPDQVRHIDELLISIPKALSEMPRLEELLMEIRTPDLRVPEFHITRQVLDMALLRYPKYYPDTPHVYLHRPDAAVLYIRAEGPTEQQVKEQWQASVLAEWGRTLLGYQCDLNPPGYDDGLLWAESEVVPWQDEEVESEQSQVPIHRSVADGVYITAMAYTDSYESDPELEVTHDWSYATSGRFRRNE